MGAARELTSSLATLYDIHELLCGARDRSHRAAMTNSEKEPMRLLEIAALILVATAAICPCSAEDFHFNSIPRFTKEHGWAVGTGRNYKWPSTVKTRFTFDTARFRFGTFITDRQENILDLGIGMGVGSDARGLYTATYSNRRYVRVSEHTAWSVEFGEGLTKFEHQMPELATRVNFTTMLGLAYHHTVSSDSAMSVEYVFSHTSNGDTKQPNTGINIGTVLLGYSVYK
jgi:hypothetical protein